MKKPLLFMLALLFYSLSYSQSTGISAEVHAVHNGMVGAYDLTGYTTYRFYVEVESNADFVSAVYGLQGDDENPDDEDLAVSSSGDCFEHPIGSNLSSYVDCDLFSTYPALAFDSYLSIGDVTSCTTGTLQAAATFPPSFPNDVCGTWIDDGIIFTFQGSPNGLPENNRVMFAQITTNGAVDISTCVQVFVGGDQSNEDQACYSLSGILGGCTDPESPSYNPSATIDDGSCGGELTGCTDPLAINYNENATVDDGSCNYDGCTDPEAGNYEPLATNDDGSCLYYGCMSEEACNFDPDATVNQGCEWPGCGDPDASNYNPDAPCFDSSICDYISEGEANYYVELYQAHDGMVGESDLTGYNTYRIYVLANEGDFVSSLYGLLQGDELPDDKDLAVSSDCACFDHDLFGDITPTFSCALYDAYPDLEFDSYLTIGMTSSCDFGNVSAASTVPAEFPESTCGTLIDDGVLYTLNGNPNGVVDDSGMKLVAQITTCGNVSFEGCVQIFEGGNNSFELLNCGSTYIQPGCTEPGYMNYDPEATVDDGSCDGLLIAGCMDPEACNFNSDAEFDDASCNYPDCMDVLACNYNANAECEDNNLCVFVTLHSVEGENEVLQNSIEPYSYEETAESTYNWSVTGGNVDSGQGTANVNVLWEDQGTGIITIVETDATGCVGEAVEFTVSILPEFSVNEALSSMVELYPVPTNGVLNISVPEQLIGSSFEVIDVVGQVVIASQRFNSTNKQLNVSALATGIYFIRGQQNGETYTLRFVIGN